MRCGEWGSWLLLGRGESLAIYVVSTNVTVGVNSLSLGDCENVLTLHSAPYVISTDMIGDACMCVVGYFLVNGGDENPISLYNFF